LVCTSPPIIFGLHSPIDDVMLPAMTSLSQTLNLGFVLLHVVITNSLFFM